MITEYHKNKFENSHLRIKYNPNQLMLSRAIKAQAICEEAGLINTQSLEKAQHINFISDEDQIYNK